MDDEQFIYKSHRQTAKVQFLAEVELFSWKYTREARVSWSNWLGYKLDGLEFTSQWGLRDPSVLQIIQIGSGAHPILTVGTRGLSWE